MGSRKGRLISFEGPDGCGKSTQIAMLAKALRSQGRRVLVTREPGGTRTGAAIRQMLLDKKNKALADRAELFLYLADRAQHVQEFIEPALRGGGVVLVDRYLDSTWVYQGAGRKFPLDFIERCNAFAVGACMPDLTLVFDLPAQEGLARRNKKDYDRMESQALAFHRRVRSGFLALARKYPKRVVVLDARDSRERIHGRVLELVTR